MRRDFNRIKQQYGASVQKAARLEQELNQANSKIKSLESKETTSNTSTLSNELCEVKRQLAQKSALLDQVKFLLQKAAVREKLLQEDVSNFSIRLIIKHCIIFCILYCLKYQLFSTYEYLLLLILIAGRCFEETTIVLPTRKGRLEYRICLILFLYLYTYT